MLSLVKKVLEEYKYLIMIMNYDLHTISYVKTTFEFLCDTLRLSWGLACIMPMLEIIIHELIKFVESHETFVCDFT